MQLTGLARLGKDAELRTIQGSGDKVASLSLAFNYGRKGQDGNRPTQWVDASLWGKLAEALIDYLVKGQQVVVTIDDPHIETFDGRNGPVHKLAGKITSIELAGARQPGDNSQRQTAAPAQRQAPAPQRAPAQNSSSGFDDMGDDCPF